MPSTLQILTTVALLLLLLTTLTLLNLTLTRLHRILTRPTPSKQLQRTDLHPRHSNRGKGHLLIILGSGGHTTEMLSTLHNLGHDYLDARFQRRTWVVSSGDGFSAGRAREFEMDRERERVRSAQRSGGSVGVDAKSGSGTAEVTWDIVTVRRARKVHQSLLTTPVSALGCLWDCVRVLRGHRRGEERANIGVENSNSSKETTTLQSQVYTYPDLILTNGPGTGVIMVLASLLLLFCGVAPVRVRVTSTSPSPSKSNQATTRNEVELGSMRSIYIESWARVKTLSLSGKILRFLAGRVLVQWRGLADVDLTDSRVDVENGEMKGNGNGSGRERNASASVWPRKMEYVGAIVT